MNVKNGRVFNLLLQGTFPISETSSDFIQAHKEDAIMWQKKKMP